jgi:poly-gamma-glutamate synthesis protein (capsule biosynthesis protein)
MKIILLIAGCLFFLSCAQQEPLVKIDHTSDELLPSAETGFKKRRRLPLDTTPKLPLAHVAAVGDLMMSSWVIDKVNHFGVDFPFDSTRKLLSAADFAIANLEAPFTATGTVHKDKKFTFKVPPHFGRGLLNAGIDVVTLANNHMIDYGCEGLINTLSTLDSLGIAYSGGGIDRQTACAPVIVERKGKRIAFLGFSFTYPVEFWANSSRCGTCHPSEQQLQALIEKSKADADLVVASFHWGQEKRTTPKAYQTYFARKSIDFGADLVLGHHPHVLQGIEIYKGKLIAYSLGNYVFGSLSHNSRTSIVLSALLGPNGLIYARVFPIDVYNARVEFQPKLFYGTDRLKVIDELNEISAHLNNGESIIDAQGFILPAQTNQEPLTPTD